MKRPQDGVDDLPATKKAKPGDQDTAEMDGWVKVEKRKVKKQKKAEI
jgi:hypothetical protein